MQFLAEVLVDFEIEEYIVYSNKHIYIYIERESLVVVIHSMKRERRLF
jgi:hypothetical protein